MNTRDRYSITPEDPVPNRGSVHGSQLPDQFNEALMHVVQIGPRREIILSIQTLQWSGPNSHYSPEKRLRFGGIDNFGQVSAFFTEHPELEIAFLRPSAALTSKPGRLYFQLQLERTDDQLVIQCSSFHVN